MTATRRQTVFAGLDQPQAWPATRGRPQPQRLESALDTLPGVGPTLKRRLAKLGLETVRDLLEHRPWRYEAAVPEVAIAALRADEEVAIAGEVLNVNVRRRGRRTIVTARISDGTATISASWFNQAWLADQLGPGVRVRLRGKSSRYGFDVKSYDLGDGSATADFAPVYPAGEEISPQKLRALVAAALTRAGDYVDPLPVELRVRENLPLKSDALVAIHHPTAEGEAETGRRRLAFEELLVLQLGIARRVAARQHMLAPSLGEPGELIARYRATLPFALTPYQEKAMREIDADLARTVPMQRLLQGDVGSGKTVVALYALLRAVENGRQGALMAPTETLAEQHFLTVADLCFELGVTCALLTSASSKRERDAATGADVVVGTHALIQEGVELRDLAVAVVDEQHRFGVEQRKALAQGRVPHVLHMTATPIPRTLALTVFGDLDVTTITGVPSGRQPVVTRLVDEDKREVGYDFVRKQIARGRQVYVVCPAIDESESILAATAVAEAERLQSGPFREVCVAVVHGQLKSAERDRVMQAFKAGAVQVLVATSLIEVGIDVPNATVMIVEGAERFGLAQLHQLRGRVGRGTAKSYCLLFSQAETGASQARLEALLQTNDGFELADRDLELRGEGQLMGARQAGVPDLRLARLARDREALLRARQLAAEILAADPGLVGAVDAPLRDAVEAAFGHELAWLLKA